MSCNHRLNGNDRERRADAEACGGQSRREPAAIGKPFEGVADAGAVHSASPKPPYDLSDVQHRKRACGGVENPSEPGETPAHKHDNLRPEATMSECWSGKLSCSAGGISTGRNI